MQQPANIICEVHQTVDGYSIYCPSKDIRTTDWNGSDCWWGHYCKGSKAGWEPKYRRKTYRFKWSAVMKAKELEEEMNAERRKAERRRAFVERKVWR